MKIDASMLAMMPIAYLLNREDPFTRYRDESAVLDPAYRDVVNAGVLGYQLFAYLALVDEYFSQEVQRMIRDYQLRVLERKRRVREGTGRRLELIEEALWAGALRIPTAMGNNEVPVEMYVALTLLLNDPLSPDYTRDASQRREVITCMGTDVDWCFAGFLLRGREEIMQVFAAMLSHTELEQESLRKLRNPRTDY